MHALIAFTILVGCPAPLAITRLAMSASHSSNAATGSAAPRAVWVSTTACVAPAGSSDGTKMPPFDARRCLSLTERIVLDGEVVDERVPQVEKLTIEDVAVKVEALLGVANDDDSD